VIVNLHKYLICGAKEELDHFFELAQRAGFLEFIGLSHKKALELPEEAKMLLAAIRIAKRHEIHPQEAQASSDPLTLAKKIIEFQSMLEQFFEERRLLTAEISRIAAFGDFSREDLHTIDREAKRVLQFFCMKSSLAREITLPPELIYVGTEYDLDYFVSINKEPTQYPKMIEILVDRPVGELRERLALVKTRISQLESDIRHYSNTLPILQSGLTDLLNGYHLMLAKHDASHPMSGSLFAIEAWVPETKTKSLLGLLGNLQVFAEEITIESSDRIPTCMENRGAGKLGEDLVHVYDTPAHTDKDPSSWVLVFFTLFFSMIVADAGYGLIFLALSLYLKYKFPNLSGLGKRFIKMCLIISSCCILWGVFTASFFGLEIGPNNPYRRFSVLHTLASVKAEYHMKQKDDVYEEYLKEYPAIETAKDGHDFLVLASKITDGKRDYEALNNFYDNILMELSLLVGVIHLSLSFLRYLFRNWSGLGWIIFMIGGYLFFPKILNATTLFNFTGLISKSTAAAWGEQMVYGGIGLAFVLALKRGWGALHELTNVVQVFADVLSYLRLYALALAGMIMASTFNTIGINMGFFAGVLVIILGHLSTLTTSVMGGVIHGLRLNFLEWYHYGFEGGGRLFNPLRLKKAK
jgi:V/A-type H+-transporting ATPase subunit I